MAIFERKIFNELINHQRKTRILILLGARQVGKTTLLKQMMAFFQRENKKCVYFSLESTSNLELFSQKYEDFIEYLKSKSLLKNNEQLLIFVDEFQYAVDISKLFKAIYDLTDNIHIIASGSSSLDIRKKLEEPLVGRKRTINIYPLNFSEYLKFNNIDLPEIESIDINKPMPSIVINEYKKAFDNFVIWGGMPAVTLEQDVEEKRYMLNEIYDTYIKKDIKGILINEHIPGFNKLIKLIMIQTGQLLNIEEVSKLIQQKRTITERILFILEQTFVNFALAPFFSNVAKEIIKSKKTFFYDTGIRNQSINDFSDLSLRQDKGALLETAVFNEFLKNLKISQNLFFYRTRNATEIDFIIKQDNKICPIELKLGSMNTIPKAFIFFVEKYNIKTGIVLNKDIFCKKQLGKSDIYFVPYFLAERLLTYFF